MNKISKQHSFRIPQQLYDQTKKRAVQTGISVGSLIRCAVRQFDERELQIDKAKKILAESKVTDMQKIIFPANQSYVTNKMGLYVHKSASIDMQSIGPRTDDRVMDFMRTSMLDGTLLSKCRTEAVGRPHIVSFKAHLFDVYCEVGPGQITILAVS